MKTPRQIANAFRTLYRLAAGEPAVSVLSRVIIGKDGQILIDGEKLRLGDTAHMAAVRELIGANEVGTVDFDAITGDAADNASLVAALDLKADLTDVALKDSGTLNLPVVDGVTYSALNKRQVITTAFAITGAALHAGNLTAVTFPAAAIVLRALLDVTTVSTGIADVDIGYTAVSATTASASLFNAVDVNEAVALYDSGDPAGAESISAFKAASGKWITVHETADTTGLVATLYVQFILA